jgi:hypothetical protein
MAMGLPAALGLHDLDRRIHVDQFPEEEMAVKSAQWRMWNAKGRVYVKKMKIFIPHSALCIPHFEGKAGHHV